MTNQFDIDCRQCSRLANFLDDVNVKHPSYYCKPVPAFGDEQVTLLIVGLAPGLHGANRTGRPFTGDASGELLYQTLHKFGLANQPQSHAVDDGLQLINCRITNAVKCLPPQNKPLTSEVKACSRYLAAELDALPANAVILALGSVAHQAVVRVLNLRQRDYRFGHGVWHTLPNQLQLVDSYHCSRYNTQTKRLTTPMFCQVFARIVAFIHAA